MVGIEKSLRDDAQQPLRGDEAEVTEDSPMDEAPDVVSLAPSGNADIVETLLETDIRGKGKNQYQVVRNCRENIIRIFQNDERFLNLRFNVVTRSPVTVNPRTGKRTPWLDEDDAITRAYMESVYGLESQQKYDDAIRAFMKTRKYNPIQRAIEATEWDGKPRVKQFLSVWMGADCDAVTEECSRLLFAGAIRRAYDPGCKFDYCVVLIGSQGGGKSTLCRWLALEDDFYTSLKTIKDQKGSEAIQGKWIVEIEELLAVLANEKSGTVAEEEAKGFLSRQSEYYRKPWDRRVTDTLRTNIFIGTTNRNEFLTDPTGNRRWFPVRCNATGYDLFDREAECKQYIRQAYAEMLAAYRRDDHLAAPVADRNLEMEIRARQQSAEVEDPWLGMIEGYVDGTQYMEAPRDRVCCLEVYENAILGYGSGSSAKGFRSTDANKLRAYTRKIGALLVDKLGWKRGNTEDFGEYGKAKAFYRPVS